MVEEKNTILTIYDCEKVRPDPNISVPDIPVNRGGKPLSSYGSK